MPFEPPIGTSFTSDNDARPDVVIQTAARILPFLQAQNISPVRLRRYDDWLEHDGLHFPGPQIEFLDVFRLFASPRSLFEATPEDEAVCIGIGPESSDWYLRARAHWNSVDTELVGMISITMHLSLAQRFREEVQALSSLPLSEEESIAYFSRITQ
jgi:hypothetical protein